jgi:hypothetical protein
MAAIAANRLGDRVAGLAPEKRCTTPVTHRRGAVKNVLANVNTCQLPLRQG